MKLLKLLKKKKGAEKKKKDAKKKLRIFAGCALFTAGFASAAWLGYVHREVLADAVMRSRSRPPRRPSRLYRLCPHHLFCRK